MKSEIVIEVQEWDTLVGKTYGKPYMFQQQDGCKLRGVHRFTVPAADYDDSQHESIPEVVNGEIRGVKFAVWLDRDPKQPLEGDPIHEQWNIDLWWERNFYPDFQTLANDMCTRGVIPPGDYMINIDW